jgi:hypothetical protein
VDDDSLIIQTQLMYFNHSQNNLKLSISTNANESFVCFSHVLICMSSAFISFTYLFIIYIAVLEFELSASCL